MPTAELTDISMHYEIEGVGDPLVLIPGLGNTVQVWDPVTPDLNRHFTLICTDSRGVGRSIAKRPARTVRDYSSDLVELLDHLQLDQVHVVGLSLGGIIAQRFAVDHPSRLRRLVLISCTYNFTPYLREMARLVGQTLRWFPKTTFARTMEVLGCGPRYFDADPDRINQRIEKMREMNVSTRAIMRQLRALGSSKVNRDEYRIVGETLVIAGEFDTLIPHCYSRQMASLIEGSRFLLIPECGHNPFNDVPEQVLPLIIEFLGHGQVAPQASMASPTLGIDQWPQTRDVA